MGRTTKQHYVPQFYLRSFAAMTPGRKSEPVLWVYDKDGGQPRPQTPYNTMAEYGFYDFENTTGHVEALDKGLQQIESVVAPVFKELESA
jgi:hypothetical protein